MLAEGDWSEVCLEAEIDDDLASLCIWVTDSSGNETYPAITSDLTKKFVKLRAFSKDDEKGLWSKCLYKLENDGSFNLDFSYEKPQWA